MTAFYTFLPVHAAALHVECVLCLYMYIAAPYTEWGRGHFVAPSRGFDLSTQLLSE